MWLWILGLVATLVWLWRRVSRLEAALKALEQRVEPAGSGVRPTEDSPAQTADWTAEARPSMVTGAPQTQESVAQPPTWEQAGVPSTPESSDREEQPGTSAGWHPGPPQVSRTSQGSQSSPKTANEPLQPTLADRAISWVKRYFTEGNLIVRVGVIVLFFGVAFLLQYANDQGALPVQLKVLSVALLGLVLLVLGWRLRHSRGTYALIMQGGGLGILYITGFAALRLFQLLSPTVSLALMVALVVVSALLAVVQNARALAVMAVTGGFLAPILASTGEGSHLALFSYYALLNAGILAIAWFKSWRILNLLGFVFTFVVGTVWGVLSYRPSDLPVAQAFLILFFLFYVLIALLFARRQPPKLKGYVDATLVFGVPLVGFGLQAGLVANTEYGLALSALALGGFYALLVVLCRRFGAVAFQLLGEAYLALAVVFASLSIPFALEPEWVATAWALEGAAVLWICLRQQRLLGAFFALGLQGLAGLLFLTDFFYRSNDLAIVNPVFVGGLLVALAGLFSSDQLRTSPTETTHRMLRLMSVPMLLWGLCWWLANGVLEIVAFAPSDWILTVCLVFLSITASALGWLAVRLSWRELDFTPIGLLGFMLLAAVPALLVTRHPFEDYSLIGWAALYLSLARLLWQHEKRCALPGRWVDGLHLLGWGLLVVLLAKECYWHVTQWVPWSEGWAEVAMVLVLLPAVWLALRAPVWPFRSRPMSYRVAANTLWLVLLVIWSLVISTASSGQFDSIGYVPLLNPLDIVQLLVLITLWYGWQGISAGAGLSVPLNRGVMVIAGLGFVWANAVLMRSIHHWTGVTYEFEALFGSSLAQAVLSVFWTLTGLSVMVLATRRGWREVWLAAACLLALVVAKLFLIDMQDSNTLEAIISFIAVGLLLLVVGYFSPMPPKQQPAER